MTRFSLPGALLLALTLHRGLPAQNSPAAGAAPSAPPAAAAPRAAVKPAAKPATKPATKPAAKPAAKKAPAKKAAARRPAATAARRTPPRAPAARLQRPTTVARLTPPARSAPFAALGGALGAPAPQLRDSIVAMARAQLGTRYVLGGTTPERGFDCSGLIRYIAQALRVDLPRTANEQSRVGLAVEVDPTRLRPGDLVTFGQGSVVDHIGIYVGGGKFIHASTAAGRVIESDLVRRPVRGIKPWQGVRRLFADAGDDRPLGDG